MPGFENGFTSPPGAVLFEPLEVKVLPPANEPDPIMPPGNEPETIPPIPTPDDRFPVAAGITPENGFPEIPAEVWFPLPLEESVLPPVRDPGPGDPETSSTTLESFNGNCRKVMSSLSLNIRKKHISATCENLDQTVHKRTIDQCLQCSPFNKQFKGCYTFNADNCQNCICSVLKGIYSKKKEFAPLSF